MALTAFSCLLLAAAVAAYGGPPLPYGDLPFDIEKHGAVDLPLPGKEIVAVPFSSVAVPVPMPVPVGLWDAYLRAHRHRARVDNAAPLTVDDVDRVDGDQQPPLQHAFPVHFRSEEAALDAVLDLSAAEEVSLTAAPGPAPANATAIKGITSWLPERVQEWLPSLPSLPSLSSFIPHLPSYIPGVVLEAEVHRKPSTLPTVPTPGDLLRRVNRVLDTALTRIRRKEHQLMEIIKCSCPRPARCEGLFQEFLSLGSPDVAAPASSSGSAEPNEPDVSFFAELTKPNGEHGPGFGFYVDQSGPHIGHHVHNASAEASAQPSAQASSAVSSSATSELSDKPITVESLPEPAVSPDADAIEFPKGAASDAPSGAKSDLKATGHPA